MMTIIAKVQRFVSQILSHFVKREFSLGLFKLTDILPEWSFKFNKAFILENKISSMQIPEQLNKSVNVRIATDQDIEAIERISKWKSDRIANLLNSGAVCFIASLDKHPPVALTWLAFGTCYVRGMAYRHHFPKHCAYGVFSITLPEFRGQGFYLQMNESIREYANGSGIDTYVVLVEFTNIYNLNLQKKTGIHQGIGDHLHQVAISQNQYPKRNFNEQTISEDFFAGPDG